MSSGPTDPLVRRCGPVLSPDPTRVLIRPFLPGQELGVSRAEAVVSRVMALDDAEVTRTLARTLELFAGSHADIAEIFREHAAMLPRDLDGLAGANGERMELVGAYVTQEYALEAAAILNPSIVAHPDQSGLGVDELRVVLSLRAIGEGHISSLELRTGVVSADGEVTLDEVGGRLTRGEVSHGAMSVDYLRAALQDFGSWSAADAVVQALPDPFRPDELEDALRRFEMATTPHVRDGMPLDRVRRIAESCYRLEFDPRTDLSERVLFPASADERGGIEDVRLVRFVEDDGTVDYRGTYTAYDGAAIAPHLLTTVDFTRFDVQKLVGPAAQNKGMALFPRPVGGRYWSLARWDRENICIADSPDGLAWHQVRVLQRPRRPWELIQLGPCAPPVETPEGWLVVTHGVGPVRSYALGAMLLDLDDPSQVLAGLTEPLLTPEGDERVGYVPNVVYSCGAVLHGRTLVLPYGCSDSSVRFARVDVDGLIGRLLGH